MERKEGEERRNLKDREERWIGFEERGRRRVVMIAGMIATATTFPTVTEEAAMEGIYKVWMVKKTKMESC